MSGLTKPNRIHDFELTSKNPAIIAAVYSIMKQLSLGNRKLNIKKDFIVNLLVNFKLAKRTNSYLAVHRRNQFYQNSRSKAAPEYQTYKIVTSVLDELKKKGFVTKQPAIAHAHLTTYKPIGNLKLEVKKVQNKDIITSRPGTFVIIHIKNSKGKTVDKKFNPTYFSKKINKELSSYNDLREKKEISFGSLSNALLQTPKNLSFIIQHSIDDIKTIKSINGKYKIVLRNSYLVRIYNDTLKKSGRFYRGIESNMPSELRKEIYIDGRPTVELDYSAHHPRMLYHMRKIEPNATYTNFDPYNAEPNNPHKRNAYKPTFMICANNTDRTSALKALWKEINCSIELKNLLPDNSNATRNLLIDNLISHNPGIKDDLFKKKCYILMNKDSEIAHNILMHFAKLKILVLCVHDSFIIDKLFEKDLNQVMIDEYEKVFPGFYPIIK